MLLTAHKTDTLSALSTRKWSQEAGYGKMSLRNSSKGFCSILQQSAAHPVLEYSKK